MPGLRAWQAAAAHRAMGAALHTRTAAMIMKLKANPGQHFDWGELWTKMGDEQLGRKMYNFSEREESTA